MEANFIFEQPLVLRKNFFYRKVLEHEFMYACIHKNTFIVANISGSKVLQNI